MHRVLLLCVPCVLLFGQQNTGGIRAYPAGSEPACNASSRGSAIVTLGAKGQSDLLKICARDGIGRFAWTSAGQQNTNLYAHTRIVGGCPMFPDNNIWNSRADSLPLDPGSAAIIGTYRNSIVGVDTAMSINLADKNTPTPPLSLESQESDNGRYPIMPNMIMEGYWWGITRTVAGGPYARGTTDKDPGDAHFLVIQTDECKLYELYLLKKAKPPYLAESGAIFDLLSNDLRPDGWTSADAAGLPIAPGVLTYAEIFGDGEIQHMIRFTIDKSRNTYVWPARHYAARSGSPAFPPMGSRWRLRADFDDKTCHANRLSGGSYPPVIQKFLRALKNYGIILADNGSPIMLTADSDPRWGDPTDSASQMAFVNGWAHCLTGKDFEVVDDSALMINPNSAAAAIPRAPIVREVEERNSASAPVPAANPIPDSGSTPSLPTTAAAPASGGSPPPTAGPILNRRAGPPPVDPAASLPANGNTAPAPTGPLLARRTEAAPVDQALSLLAQGLPGEAAKVFSPGNFPDARQPDAVRQAYIETQLQLLVLNANAGNKCDAIAQSIDQLGADRSDLPFTFNSFTGFMKGQRFQFYLGLAELACRAPKDAVKRWQKIAKSTAPLESPDFAFPVVAAAILDPAGSAPAIAAALEQVRKGRGDPALLRYAEGMLLRAAGRNEEAVKQFNVGAAGGSPFTKYLNGSALFDVPLPQH